MTMAEDLAPRIEARPRPADRRVSPVNPVAAMTAATTPAMEPPAMYPEATRTPRSPRSFAIFSSLELFPTRYAMKPPRSTAVLSWIGQVHPEGEGERRHARRGEDHRDDDAEREENPLDPRSAPHEPDDDLAHRGGLRRRHLLGAELIRAREEHHGEGAGRRRDEHARGT